MHVIPDELLDLVAGGATVYSTETDSIPSVTVPGYFNRPSPPGAFNFPWFPSDYDHGSAPADGFEPVYLYPFEWSSNTPCSIHTSPEPIVKPANITMESLRDVMIDLSAVLAQYDMRFEHAVYVLADGWGNISTTQFFSQGETNKTESRVEIPPGYQIVAYLHNHPYQRTVEGHLPSTPATVPSAPEESDTAQLAHLMRQPGVDPGLQMYIYDSKTGKTWEYAGHGLDRYAPQGHNITDDVVPSPC
jgi:hypothetical protein